MINILQSIKVGFTMSFIEMTSHILRSILSIFGVMFGVLSLVAMLTLVGGVNRYLNEQMGQWAGSVWFWRQWDASEKEKLQWSRSPKMRFSDGTYLQENAHDVKRFYPAIERRGVVHIRGKKDRVRLKGVDQYTLKEEMKDIKISQGRWFSADDYQEGKMVCLISWLIEEKIRKQIMGRNSKKQSLLGADCLFNQKRFTIIGIFKPVDPDFKPRHLRRSVYIPITTMQRKVTGIDPDPGSIRVAVKDYTKLEQQVKNIARVLKARHRGVEDFEYHAVEWLEEIRSLLNNASLLVTVIAVISLVVGGLSIMNVMLSSISERIHEIGIRKALGAQSLQIFIQFIAESTALSVTGGLFGAIFGLAPLLFKENIKAATEGIVEPTVLLSHVVYVIGIIVSVGIIFGLYPALKASRLNPIEALRYE